MSRHDCPFCQCVPMWAEAFVTIGADISGVEHQPLSLAGAIDAELGFDMTILDGPKVEFPKPSTVRRPFQ